MMETARLSSNKTSSHSLSTSGTHEMSVVESLEDLFLRGKFRDSLSQANRYLKQQMSQRRAQTESAAAAAAAADDHDVIQIDTFKLWKYSYILNVRLEEENETKELDRVGAIALQSWYELLCQSQNNNNNADELAQRQNYLAKNDTTSQKHLEPFLHSFLGRDENNSMSLDLAWIWVKLLWAIQERSTSLVLALKLWKFCASDKQYQISLCGDHLCFLIVKALPFLALPQDDEFWNTWWTPRNEDFKYLQRKCSKLSFSPSKDAVQSLLQSLPLLHEQYRLPLLVIHEFETDLRGLVQQQDEDTTEHDDYSANITEFPASKLISPSRKSVRNVHTLLRKLFKLNIFRTIRAWVLLDQGDCDTTSSSPVFLRERAVALVTIIIASFMSWRYRTKLFQITKNLLRIAIAPARELVEAFLPERGAG